MKQKKQFIVVEHRQPELVKHLREEIAALQEMLKKLEADYRDLENRYGYEVYLNNELIDLLRQNQVPFRPLLEHAARVKRDKLL